MSPLLDHLFDAPKSIFSEESTLVIEAIFVGVDDSHKLEGLRGGFEIAFEGLGEFFESKGLSLALFNEKL